MAAGQKWTWDETIAAFALYFIVPPGRQDRHNKDVIALADALGRTPSSVGLKLANIKAGDPMREGKGMANGSKLDALVWKEYEVRGDAFMSEAVAQLDSYLGHMDERGEGTEYMTLDLPEGGNRIVVATARVNQRYFRNALLDNYENRCCFTGLAVGQLLVASHIKPWKDSDSREKVTPANGLLLNALHDRAFDQGLMTVHVTGGEYRIEVSRKVPRDEACSAWLWRLDGREMYRPRRACPRRDFIEYHNDVVFQR